MIAEILEYEKQPLVTYDLVKITKTIQLNSKKLHKVPQISKIRTR